MISEVEKKFTYNQKGDYLVSNRLFLDLVFNNICNYNCKFCIARTKSYCDEDFDKWKESFKRTIEIFNKEIDSLIILGGEATVDPKFFEKLNYINEVTKDNHIFTILTTNGYKLKNKDFLNKVIDSSIDSINISVMNHIYEYKNYLMGHKTLTYEELKNISYNAVHQLLYRILKKYNITLRKATHIG